MFNNFYLKKYSFAPISDEGKRVLFRHEEVIKILTLILLWCSAPLPIVEYVGLKKKKKKNCSPNNFTLGKNNG